jgi:hypothetical protein
MTLYRHWQLQLFQACLLNPTVVGSVGGVVNCTTVLQYAASFESRLHSTTVPGSGLEAPYALDQQYSSTSNSSYWWWVNQEGLEHSTLNTMVA